MTEAAIVRGASVVESSSIVRSAGDWDMVAGGRGWAVYEVLCEGSEGVARGRWVWTEKITDVRCVSRQCEVSDEERELQAMDVTM
jgi:hypothetical protein